MRLFKLEARARTVAKLARAVTVQRLGHDRPLFTTFYVTRRCNVRCEGCIYYDDLDPVFQGKDPDTERAKLILRRLAEAKVPVVVLAGGEPFVRRDLPEIVRAGDEAGLSLMIATNGMLATPEALAAADRHCEWVQFSPHAPAEFPERLGRRKYEDGWCGLEKMRRVLRRATLTCNITLSRLTAPVLDDMIGRSLELGVDYVKFQPMFTPEYFPNEGERREALATIARWKRRDPRRVNVDDGFLADFDRFFGPKPVVACTARRFFHIAVHVDGDVSACCPAPVPIGNLLEKPLVEILRTSPEERHDCYGCHRLDVLQALKFCGTRAGANGTTR